MFRDWRWRGFGWLLALLAIVPVISLQARETADAAPIKILADKVEVDPNTNVSVYSGHVELTQGVMRLTADSLTVSLKDGQLDKLVASGSPARFKTVLEDGRPAVGEAREIEFLALRQRLLLKGDGKLEEGGNSVANDRIVFNLETGNLSAGGEPAKGRVEVTILPANPPASEQPR